MGVGIIVCGLNGVGKSTLGKALAERLNFHFIDNEDLFFHKINPDYIYDSPRTNEEVGELLHSEVRTHENFVYAAVKGNYREDILQLYKYAVLIEVPADIRWKRVKERSFQKFGGRILPEGDLYERENNFFHMVKARKESDVAEWVESLGCPVIRVDGTRGIEENVKFIVKEIQVLAGRKFTVFSGE